MKAVALRTRWPPLNLRSVALALVLIQGFHLAEHVAQAVQEFVLGQEKAHGLLGAASDFEGVHFAYNTALAAGLFGLLVLYARRAGLWAATPSWMRSSFAAATALQSYHVVEHAVRLQEFLATGLADPRGILGHSVDVVLLHLALNSLVYALIEPLLALSAARGRRAVPSLARAGHAPSPSGLGLGLPHAASAPGRPASPVALSPGARPKTRRRARPCRRRRSGFLGSGILLEGPRLPTGAPPSRGGGTHTFTIKDAGADRG